jgi:hypothetical protein
MEWYTKDTETTYTRQVVGGGWYGHYGTYLSTKDIHMAKLTDVNWYHQPSFYISDKKVAKYHVLKDRLNTLVDLAMEYEDGDYIWNGYDETCEVFGYLDPTDTDYSGKALLRDIEEYQHYLSAYDPVPMDCIVSELIAENISLRA